MKKMVVAAVALLGTGSVAFAADLPVKAIAAPPPSPVTDWSGFYVGVHGGYGWNGTNDWETLNSEGGGRLIGTSNFTGGNSWDAMKGGLAGGQIGYNWQMNRVVIGVQGDGSWADIKGSAGNPLNLRDHRCGFDGTTDQTAECRSTIRAMGNLTARAGYLATPSTLVYGKAGINWSSIDFQVLNDVGFSGTCGPLGTTHPDYNVVNRVRAGATAGVGIEQRIWNNVTVFGEYDIVENGGTWINRNTGGTGTGGCTANFTSKTTIGATQIVKFGLNYAFGGGPKY
jgi:outer membrane immunogenic protein